jgi:uncharacterized protein (TIGR03437 family)
VLPRVFCLICAALTVPVGYSQYIGLGVNGACAGGSCPAQPLAAGATVTMPIATTLNLANGDTYTITGTITTGNPSGGPSLVDSIQVIYAGNSKGGVALGDKITLDLYAAYQTTIATGDFEATTSGTFGPGVPLGSLAQLCIASSCSAAANSPGSFSLTAPFSLAASAGGFYWDITLSVAFGAGLPVGSYVLFSNPAMPVPFIRQNRGAITAAAYGGFSSFAPGSWIEIYGANLAVGTRTWGALDFNGSNAPTTLGGTSVMIGDQASFIDYVSPTQINAQVPSGLSLGAQNLSVTTASGSSAFYPIRLSATQPGLLAPASFLIGGTQYVLAVSAQGIYILPPGSLLTVPTSRARPGDTIVLFGTGFGPVTPIIQPGQVAGQTNALATNFNILIGGTVATTTYAGLAPGSVGLYQFNVVVPNVPSNDRVPVAFNLGGTPGTQSLYIAIGN